MGVWRFFQTSSCLVFRGNASLLEIHSKVLTWQKKPLRGSQFYTSWPKESDVESLGARRLHQLLKMI